MGPPGPQASGPARVFPVGMEGGIFASQEQFYLLFLCRLCSI